MMKKRTSGNLLDFFRRPTLSCDQTEIPTQNAVVFDPIKVSEDTRKPLSSSKRESEVNVTLQEGTHRNVCTVIAPPCSSLPDTGNPSHGEVAPMGPSSGSRISASSDEEDATGQPADANLQSCDRSLQNGPKRKRRRMGTAGGLKSLAEAQSASWPNAREKQLLQALPVETVSCDENERVPVPLSVSRWDLHSTISLPSVEISEAAVVSGPARSDCADTSTPVPIPRKSVPESTDGMPLGNTAGSPAFRTGCVYLRLGVPSGKPSPDGKAEESGVGHGNNPEVVTTPTTAQLIVNNEDPVDSTEDDAEEADAAAVDINSKLGKQILGEAKKRVVAPTSAAAPGPLFSKIPSTFSSELASPNFDPALFNATPYLVDINNHVLELTASQLPIIRELPTQRQIFRFSLVAETFDTIEALKGSGGGSKKKSVVLLTNLLRLALFLSPIDFFPIVYFCSNRVAPEYTGLELGVGEGILIKIVTEVFARTEKSIKADLAKFEDLGRVAQLSRASMKILCKPASLTMLAVFSEIRSLADCTGSNSQQRKKDKIKRILVASEKAEPKYIIRFLESKMRTGIQKATLIQAVAFAFVLTPCHPTVSEDDKSNPSKSENQRGRLTANSDSRRLIKTNLVCESMEERFTNMESAVRQALCEVPNFEIIGKHLLNGCSPQQLAVSCTVTPGVPVQPMLAKPTKGIQEVFHRFSGKKFTAEFKYDGERSQIHILEDASIMVYSRNLEHLSSKYPDVVEIVKSAVYPDVTSCILDCEIVAINPDTQEILPFQVLATRKRKLIDNQKGQVNVCIFPFDCIHFNGENLIQLPLSKRRHYLRKCARESPGKIQFAASSEVTTVDEVDAFLQDAIEASCEGLMIKTLDECASYEPAKRSLNWLKIKKDYLENLTDSVDLVPIGAFHGRGKRSKVFGAYLLACYNDEDEVYQSVCRAGTGFVDSILKSLYEQLSDTVESVKPMNYSVDEKMTPDVWLSPRYVWEVRAADLSISPVHTAAKGLIKLDKGIGLRFPRFIRIRDDKSPEQATTATQVAEMYHAQFSMPAKVIPNDQSTPRDSPTNSSIEVND